MTDVTHAEAVILIRRGGTTMAVHVPSMLLRLEALIDEPDILPGGPIWVIPQSTVLGYAVEATGTADRLTIWVGPDPFAKPELVEGQAALDG
jgi:hypothetical protein